MNVVIIILICIFDNGELISRLVAFLLILAKQILDLLISNVRVHHNH